MGLARLIPRREERGADPTYSGPFYSLPGGFGLASSAYVGMGGIEDALKNAASWACIRVLVDALARTPFYAVREIRGVREKVEPMPRILARPSVLVDTDVWRGSSAFSVVTDGNVFGMVVNEDNAGRPDQIELLDPTKVTDRKVEKGRATVKVEWKDYDLWPNGPVWHMPGDMVPPGSVFGISPLQYANKIIGTSLAAEDFSYRFFADGGHPPIAVTSEQELHTDQSDEIKRNYQRATKGTREPIVMGSGLDLKELHLDPSETQFIDLMRFCVEQACRFWGVPPSMIFSSIGGQHMTYSNVTQADLHFLKHALEGKLVRYEHAYTALLPGNNYTAPSVPNTLALADRNVVLKPDPQTRYATNLIALESRTKTINEVRAEEGDPPFEGEEFDLPGVPPFAPTGDPAEVSLVAVPKKKPKKPVQTGGDSSVPADGT